MSSFRYAIGQDALRSLLEAVLVGADPDEIAQLSMLLTERDRQLEDHIDNNSGGAGAPTLIVAASNALASSKARADYTCDGTADDVEILAAYAAMASVGGKVLLSEGTFNVAVEIPDGGVPMHLAGAGIGVTILKASATIAAPLVSFTAALSCASDFTLDGDAKSRGLYSTGDYTNATNVEVKNSTGEGIRQWGKASLTANCRTVGNARSGIHVAGNTAEPSSVVNCVSSANTFYGIHLANASAAGCVAHDNGLHGFNAAELSQVVGCQSLANTQNGICVNGSRAVVIGNLVYLSGRHGIGTAASVQDCLIHANHVHDSSQAADNTYDDICLGNGVVALDRNTVTHNKCLISLVGAPNARYGLNITAGVNTTFAHANDLRTPVAYATGQYNDAGAGTVTALDANNQRT